jgi:hypothetical protein
VIDRLLRAKPPADINARGTTAEMTPLMFAVCFSPPTPCIQFGFSHVLWPALVFLSLPLLLSVCSSMISLCHFATLRVSTARTVPHFSRSIVVAVLPFCYSLTFLTLSQVIANNEAVVARLINNTPPADVEAKTSVCLDG